MINVFYGDYINIRTPISSKRKLLLLKERWEKDSDINLIKKNSINKEELYLCHNPEYIENIFNKKVSNGYKNFNLDLAEMDLGQCNSMYESSLYSLRNKTISCSLTAGFHHSNYSSSGPYCTFNGLIYAAIKLKEQGLVNKVGIIDLDFHQGDGTNDIIRNLNIDWIKHLDSAEYGVSNTFKFFLDIKKDLEFMKDCDLIIYLAGMDMYINDPKGGLLEKEELERRDEMIFQWAKNNDIPITWTLAGGYSEMEELIPLHDSTMQIAKKIYSP